jgi:hypothetical protein
VRTELSRGTILGIKIGGKWRIPASQFGVPIAPFVVHEKSSGRTSEVESLHAPNHVEPLGLPEALPPAHAIPPPQPAQPTLRIKLLGRPQIFIDDVRLDELERSSRRSELLYLLALHRDGLSGAQLGNRLNAAKHRYEDDNLDPRYVRTLVWGVRDQARKKCRWDGVVESAVRHGRGPQRYMLPENTICDLWEFQEKLNRADALTATVTATVSRLSASGKRLPGKTIPQLFSEFEQLLQTMQTPAHTLSQEEVLALAATIREEALRLYRGDFCDGSANGCLADAARIIEQSYISSAIEQGGYWRWIALRTQEANRSYFSRISAVLSVMEAGAKMSHVEADGSAYIDLLSPQRHTHMRAAWREALLNYERVLDADPYYEDACICAMECHIALGNRRGMDSTFTRYKEGLKQELQQEPSNRIVRAFEACRSKPGFARVTWPGDLI